MSILTIIVTFILVVAALGCFLAIILVAVRSSASRDTLPALLPSALLPKKEASMLDDLRAVSEKMGLLLFARVPLSAIVEAERDVLNQAWQKKLNAHQVDFIFCDPRTLKTVMVILPAEPGAAPGPQRQTCIAVLSSARIPYIQLGNYNLPGLEKAVKEKLLPKEEEPLPPDLELSVAE